MNARVVLLLAGIALSVQWTPSVVRAENTDPRSESYSSREIGISTILEK